MQTTLVYVDFRAIATHFVNIFVFMLIFDFFYGFGGVQWAVMDFMDWMNFMELMVFIHIGIMTPKTMGSKSHR